MSAREWTTSARWLHAIKPASWPKLLVPMALGQALGIFASGSVSLPALVIGLLFTLGMGGFIVLMNDWGDQEVDTLKRQMFPDGCSPKTIPDGILPAHHVLIAGLLSGAFALLVAGAAWALGWEHALQLGLGCVLLFVAYTLPPIQLNYRGGGELLEMLGVGLALPWFNAYLQSDNLFAQPYMLLGGYILLSLGSALASGLSDELSDREGGKRTFTTMFGNLATRRATEACMTLGSAAWLIAWWQNPELVPGWIIAAPTVVVSWYQLKVLLSSDAASTNAWRALGEYKMHLHHAIWRSGMILTAGLAAYALWMARGGM